MLLIDFDSALLGNGVPRMSRTVVTPCEANTCVRTHSSPSARARDREHHTEARASLNTSLNLPPAWNPSAKIVSGTICARFTNASKVVSRYCSRKSGDFNAQDAHRGG
jgi:hypothetical protein